jgi:polysaccharide pyruvyl transferase WcaK-like protein
MLKKLIKIEKKWLGAFFAIFRLKGERTETALISKEAMVADFREWGFYSERYSGRPRILMAAGHGYGNVGDEAQCGACISRWRRVAPNCRITLFSPNPAYTEALHGERAEWAPRVAWFRANTSGPYFARDIVFRLAYYLVSFRVLLSCRFIRAGIPFTLLRPRESKIIQLLIEHDILHISGGGFLTGKTRSRLWENCLLMRICQMLNKPYILTGHNIGVFQDRADRRLAYKGLSGARLIELRDRGISEKELEGIGIAGEHVRSTCDDALLCDRAAQNVVKDAIKDAGLDPEKPWVAVQFHYWGQPMEDREKIAKRYAELCDHIVEQHGLQIALIAMTPSDVEPELAILELMEKKGALVPYSPDYRLVRGVIADAEFVFTMKHHPIVFAQGEGVPVVGVSLDDYYYHKNKGALDNTGDGGFLSHANEFYTETPERHISEVMGKRVEIRNRMLSWVNQMRANELSSYEDVCR